MEMGISVALQPNIYIVIGEIGNFYGEPCVRYQIMKDNVAGHACWVVGKRATIMIRKFGNPVPLFGRWFTMEQFREEYLV